MIYFNPRTREGCDPRLAVCITPDRHFNPRTREGCDEEYDVYILEGVLFQSTHPRGVRPYLFFLYLKWRTYFNPRTREGCDLSE